MDTITVNVEYSHEFENFTGQLVILHGRGASLGLTVDDINHITSPWVQSLMIKMIEDKWTTGKVIGKVIFTGFADRNIEIKEMA